MKDFAKSIRTGNSKYKEGQTVKTKEGEGTIVKVQTMGLSKTPSYKIRLESGKEIWLYEEEVGNKKVGNDQDLFNNYKDWTIHSYKDKKGGFSAEIIKKGSGRGFDETSSYSSESGAIDAAKKLIDMYAKEVGNKKVGNGSGHWKGNSYEDGFGNSATVMKVGGGYTVFWEDDRGIGKRIGIYKDEKTAKEVAVDAVETEMPDKIKSNYASKAVNKKVENKVSYNELDNWISTVQTYADSAKRTLVGSLSATNIVNALSNCKQACDKAMKLVIQYDTENNKRK